MAKKHKKNSTHQNDRGPQPPRRADDTPDAWDDDEDAGGTIFGLPEGLDLSQLSADLGDEFEIVGADEELDILDVDVSADLADVLPTLPLDIVLQQLASSEGLPPERELRVFSDLSQRDAETVRSRWGQIADTQRRAVAELLVTVAQDELTWMLGRFLRILLNDADAGVREAAVRGLWDEDDPALIGPLVQMLHGDPATGVRAAAATALGAYVLAGEL